MFKIMFNRMRSHTFKQMFGDFQNIGTCKTIFFKIISGFVLDCFTYNKGRKGPDLVEMLEVPK